MLVDFLKWYEERQDSSFTASIADTTDIGSQTQSQGIGIVNPLPFFFS